MMICRYCLCSKSQYFEEGHCRRCLSLRSNVVNLKKEKEFLEANYSLNFKLTEYQESISNELINTIEKQDIFLEAVCGAGKTEMCYAMIKYLLEKGYRVGWAIPRRQVVLELGKRLKEDFLDLDVAIVCEGMTDNLEGDLIICTTHQLYRYHDYFDYLILDEPDAFPFYNNDLLWGLMRTSVKSNILFMSATIDAQILAIENIKHLKMSLRPSLELLPVPQCYYGYISIIRILIAERNEKQLIFVPTIKSARRISMIFRVPYITSQSDDKELIVEKFDKKDNGKLITTTVLERGVTFENCFVYVLNADHIVYTKASLIQIAGRVKRGSSTKGACYFFCLKMNQEVIDAIQQIEETNDIARRVLNQSKKDKTL